MGKLINIKNKKFGMITVIKKLEENATNKSSKWLCVCDCGNELIKSSYYLRNVANPNCGCLKSIQTSIRFKKHGLSNTRIYKTWTSMKKRCFCKTNKDYYLYGGRNIKMCNEWKISFLDFYNWAIDNGYTDNLTIERIDVNKDYCPENCSWILNEEQAQNTRRTRKFIYNDKIYTIRQLLKFSKVTYNTLKNRLTKLNWDVETALNKKPIKGSNQYGTKGLSARNL